MNTPAVKCADFAADVRYIDQANKINVMPLRISVPKNLTRRRVYACIFTDPDASFSYQPDYTGTLTFSLDGQPVLILPFTRHQNLAPGFAATLVSLRPGAQGLTTSTTNAESSLRRAQRDSLMVTPGAPALVASELIVPPMHHNVTCDTIELAVPRYAPSTNIDGAVLACHSEGEDA